MLPRLESFLAEVDAAKADGRWEAAYESQRNAVVPPDLAAALAGAAHANAAFEQCQSQAPQHVRISV